MTSVPRCIALALTLSALMVTGCSRDEAADEGSHAPARSAGQDDLFVATLQQQYGITIGSDVATHIALVACESPTAGVGLYNAQRALQQRYPDYSLNTVATVMSVGVLAYCPERLA